MRGGKSASWRDQDLADRITSEAEAFIKESAGKPIFLYFATNDIHVPRDPSPRFRGASGLGIRGDATVQLDDCLGRIRRALSENGYEDTLFISPATTDPASRTDTRTARAKRGRTTTRPHLSAAGNIRSAKAARASL